MNTVTELVARWPMNTVTELVRGGRWNTVTEPVDTDEKSTGKGR
jgi:hypothetical protein